MFVSDGTGKKGKELRSQCFNKFGFKCYELSKEKEKKKNGSIRDLKKLADSERFYSLETG